MGKNRQNRPTLKGCNFGWKQDMKNLNTYLKSAKFKVSEKYTSKYFKQVEKIFIFFFFIFHFHFRILRKFLKAYLLPLRIIFSTRHCFWLYLFSFKRNWPKCADCQNFWNKLFSLCLFSNFLWRIHGLMFWYGISNFKTRSSISIPLEKRGHQRSRHLRKDNFLSLSHILVLFSHEFV